MWDLLLSSEQEAEQRAGGSILLTALLQLQMEYMGTRKAKIMVQGSDGCILCKIWAGGRGECCQKQNRHNNGRHHSPSRPHPVEFSGHP